MILSSGSLVPHRRSSRPGSHTTGGWTQYLCQQGRTDLKGLICALAALLAGCTRHAAYCDELNGSVNAGHCPGDYAGAPVKG
jgi:hypothetical protein